MAPGPTLVSVGTYNVRFAQPDRFTLNQPGWVIEVLPSTPVQSASYEVTRSTPLLASLSGGFSYEFLTSIQKSILNIPLYSRVSEVQPPQTGRTGKSVIYDSHKSFARFPFFENGLYNKFFAVSPCSKANQRPVGSPESNCD